jgi:hypothetical protein
MPMVNENFPSGGAPEFPGFSTQMTIGGMTTANEDTPNSEDSTPKSRKNYTPAWNTEQNLEQTVLSVKTKKVNNIGVKLLATVLSISHSILHVMLVHAETVLII